MADDVNDDVKAAVEAAHARITAIEEKSGGEPDLRIGLWALEKVVDGEAARTAAAVAAAEKRVKELEGELAAAAAFHNLAVKERDYERVRYDNLKAKFDKLFK